VESIPFAASQASPDTWWAQPAFVLRATAYTAQGKNASTTRYTSDGAVAIVGSVNYDAFNRVISETDPAGLTITHEYDAADNLLKTTYPAVTSSGEVQGTAVTYQRSPYNAAVADTVVDRAGNTTHFAYDANFRLITEANTLGGTTNRTFDVLGRVFTETDPAGNLTHHGVQSPRPADQDYASGSRRRNTRAHRSANL